MRQICGTIGAVVPSLDNLFFASVIDGIEAYARNNAYSLLLRCAQNDPEREMACITEYIYNKAAGVIVISPNTENLRQSLYEDLAMTIPMAFINAYHHIEGACYVANDEAAGARKALNYLYGLGHRRLMLVRGGLSDSYEIKERAFHQFLQENGLAQGSVLNIGNGNSADTVEATVEQLLPRLQNSRPTAILCCNDLMGLGAVNACKRPGLRVPEDISVIGYDNTPPAKYVEPNLTTMDQNMYELGHKAAEAIIHQIKTGETQDITLENKLIERDSTGPAV